MTKIAKITETELGKDKGTARKAKFALSGAVVKMRKAIIRFTIPVLPSVLLSVIQSAFSRSIAMEKIDYHMLDFRKIMQCERLLKYVEKI